MNRWSEFSEILLSFFLSVSVVVTFPPCCRAIIRKQFASQQASLQESQRELLRENFFAKTKSEIRWTSTLKTYIFSLSASRFDINQSLMPVSRSQMIACVECVESLNRASHFFEVYTGFFFSLSHFDYYKFLSLTLLIAHIRLSRESSTLLNYSQSFLLLPLHFRND